MVFLSIQDFADGVGQLIRDGIALINDGLENSLGTTLIEMVIQLCATLIIFLIIRFLIWNKVTEILESRKKIVRDALNERDQALEVAKKAKEEAALVKEDAIKEANRIIENAKKRGYNEAESIIVNANEQAKLKISNADEEIQRMRNESEADIKKEIIDVAYLMASKILEREVKKDSNDIALDSFIKENK